MTSLQKRWITTAVVLTLLLTLPVKTQTSACRQSFSNMPPGAVVQINFECTIRSAADFRSVPNNATALTLIYPVTAAPSLYSGSNRVLPANLGGSKLTSLSVLVSNFPLTSSSSPTVERQFPAGMFVNLPRLQILQLYHNVRSSVGFSLRLANGSFDGLSGLLILRLSRLGISELPTAVFRGLTSIVNIDLSQNRIRQIARGTFTVTDTVNFFIASNFSTSAPGPVASTLPLSSTRCCRRLAVLSLGRNDVTDMSDVSLYGLDRLERIDLHGNRLTSVDKAAFAVVYDSLVEMNLASNRITRLDNSSFAGLNRLKVLYLDNNTISAITPATFGPLLPNLTALYLDGNRLTFLTAGSFRSMPSLRTLSIHSNEISRLDRGSFEGLNELQRLTLFRNKLTSLDASQLIGIGTLLEELDLSENLIKMLNENSVKGSPWNQLRWSNFIGSSMRVLSVAGNQLTTLPISFLERAASEVLSIPGYVNLYGNRWNCDCQLYSAVVRRLLKARRRIDGTVGIDDDATCSTPPNLSGASITSAYTSVICDRDIPAVTDVDSASDERSAVTFATSSTTLNSFPVPVVTATGSVVVLVITAVCLLILISCRVRHRNIWNRLRHQFCPNNAVNDSGRLRRPQQASRSRHVICVSANVTSSSTTPTSSAANGNPPRLHLWPTYDNLAAGLSDETVPPLSAESKAGSGKILPDLQSDLDCKKNCSLRPVDSESDTIVGHDDSSEVPSVAEAIAMTSSQSPSASDRSQNRLCPRQWSVAMDNSSRLRDDMHAQGENNRFVNYRVVPTKAFSSRSVAQSSIYYVPDRNEMWIGPVSSSALSAATLEPYDPPPPYSEVCLGPRGGYTSGLPN